MDKGQTPTAQPTEAPTVTSTVVPPSITGATVVGDIVSFGHYEQDDDPTTEDALLWYVLEVKDGKALLLSKDVIEVMVFYDHFAGSINAIDDGKQCRWKYSVPRERLNAEFYNTAFTEDEKKQIIVSTIETESLDVERNPTIDTTEDNVFLLSASEVEELEESIRRSQPTLHAKNQGVYVSGSARYWTRSMDKNEYVGYYTNGDKVSFYTATYEGTGVRPAMWVKVEEER